MSSKPTTIREYLESLPLDRRAAIEAIREVIMANLDPAFEEGIQYGMIGYHVPHSRYPAGYHCDPEQPVPFAAVASQKNHIGIYLFCIYTDDAEAQRFREAWLKTGKKLDMGKSCVRVKRLEDLPLEVLGKTIKRITAKKFLASYEAGIVNRTPKKRAEIQKAAAARQAPQKKATLKKAANKTANKTSPAKRGASGKVTTGKVSKKKPGARKPATRKTTAKQTAAKKTTVKKAPARKTTAKKTTVKKVPANKSTGRKPAAQPPASRKSSRPAK